MTRIFLGLAVFASVLLTSNLMYALVIGDFGATLRAYFAALEQMHALEASSQVTAGQLASQHALVEGHAETLRRQRDRFWPHIWLGIVASLVSMLVNSISITYFIGTSRWCREVVEAYGMDTEYAMRSQRLKRRTFPWALLGIAMTLAVSGLGAAADPYASTANPAGWAPWHWTIAMAGVAIISVAFMIQVGAVGANYEVIQSILKEAERIRVERDSGE